MVVVAALGNVTGNAANHSASDMGHGQELTGGSPHTKQQVTVAHFSSRLNHR